MERTRRQVLQASGAVAGAAVFSTPVYAHSEDDISCEQYGVADLSTPTEPEQLAHDAVITEAYGDLKLTQDRPYWAFPICSLDTEPIRIEYEVRPDDGAEAPSVFVADDNGLAEYQSKVEPHPATDGEVLTTTERDLGPIGRRTVPAVYPGRVNFWNIVERVQTSESWTEDTAMVDQHTIGCLNSADAGDLYDAHTIESGDYYVVFDWTKDVLDAPSHEETTVQVSVRASHPQHNPVADEAPKTVETAYTTMFAGSDVVPGAVRLANVVCDAVPEEVHNLSVSEINAVAPEAVQLVAGVNSILTVLAEEFGYAPAVLRSVTDWASAVTRWGMAAVPVASSLDQFVNDACTVADASPDQVTDAVENMLLSLGIFIADLVMAKFGAAARVARFATRAAHKYLLGYLARSLGLKTYLLLLREVFTLTLGTLKAALQEIKELTRDIGETYDFLTDEDVQRVQRMDEDSLLSLDIDIDLFTLNPECSI